MLGQPCAGRIDVRALACHPDRSWVLYRRRDGFPDPRDPVEDRLGLLCEQVLESVLGSGLNEVVLEWPGWPQVGVWGAVGGSPELDVCDDVWHRERGLLGCPRGDGALGLDVSPNLSRQLGDQCVSDCQVGTPLSGGREMGGSSGQPWEWTSPRVFADPEHIEPVVDGGGRIAEASSGLLACGVHQGQEPGRDRWRGASGDASAEPARRLLRSARGPWLPRPPRAAR